MFVRFVRFVGWRDRASGDAVRNGYSTDGRSIVLFLRGFARVHVETRGESIKSLLAENSIPREKTSLKMAVCSSSICDWDPRRAGLVPKPIWTSPANAARSGLFGGLCRHRINGPLKSTLMKYSADCRYLELPGVKTHSSCRVLSVEAVSRARTSRRTLIHSTKPDSCR